MVANERLTEPRVAMEWLLAKPRSFSNLPAFLDLNGTKTISTIRSKIDYKTENRLEGQNFHTMPKVENKAEIWILSLKMKITPKIDYSKDLVTRPKVVLMCKIEI